MDNLSSEVSQKMRCAVKAKLIELGTGGSAGYIDDELPDYVMIMVANKRSKLQMIEDLNLFLGANTEIFVVWLHQVLEKLQEVTLPVAILKNKRKSNDSTDVPNKKDKKDKKKDKKLKRDNKEKTPELLVSSTSPNRINIPVPSITDVFADQLIQKAKQNTMEVDSDLKKEKVKSEDPAQITNITTAKNRISQNHKAIASSGDEFDIPTISEIDENDSRSTKRTKDQKELEELQNRIYLAKKQLRAMGSEESDDDDFLNLKDDDVDTMNETEEMADNENMLDSAKNKGRNQKQVRNPSPIVFDKKDDNRPSQNTDKLNKQSATPPRKPSILDRLGNRNKESNNSREQKKAEPQRLASTITSSKSRRSDKEIYVPNARKREMGERKRSIERDRKLESRIRPTTNTSSGRTRNDSEGSESRRRIGSRVIVASVRDSKMNDEEEDAIDVPVNSVVKIKPRPVIPANKQASKNLLLRAVAEAQRSTALVKPSARNLVNVEEPIEKIVSNKISSSELSYKNSSLQKTIKSNIIIEIPSKLNNNSKHSESDEYIPEPIINQPNDHDSSSNDEYVYVPRSINVRHRIDIRDKLNLNDSRTQFVVTLDGMYENTLSSNLPVVEKKITRDTERKVTTREINKPKRTTTPPYKPIVHDSKIKKSSRSKTVLTKELELSKLKRTEVEPVPLPPSVVINKMNNSSNISNNNSKNSINTKIIKSKATKSVKRLIIETNDTTDDEKDGDKFSMKEDLDEKPDKVADKLNQKRCKVSPIKFDLDNSKKLAVVSESKQEEIVEVKNNTENNGSKYDNIPSLLSTVLIPTETVKVKQKDRCKFYPGCRQGDACEFYHPTAPCKTFPNCKFGDKCLYIHPNCKFDLTCTRPDCNFQHTRPPLVPPPLASHVVPVQNYKTISATPLPAMCKFYPNCSNTLCPFYHPKLCRFGKNCLNKVECNFYHHDLPSKNKLKWVSPINV